MAGAGADPTVIWLPKRGRQDRRSDHDMWAGYRSARASDERSF